VKDEKDWLIVGRFGRPHGLKGYISVYSFTQPNSNILNYSNWVVSDRGSRTPLKVLSYEQHTRFIAVLIEGYEDRNLVSQLTNLEIAVPRESLPELGSGEYYWNQLIGMSVVNIQGETLGTVTDLIATGANDVLVVTGDARYLIPFLLDKVVHNVSLEKKEIIVDWDNSYL